MIRHVARIVVVAGLFLFSWDGAKAQTLGSLTQQCEKLESFWRQNPSRQPNMVNIPNDADAAICYGYMSAFNGLRSLSLPPPTGTSPIVLEGSDRPAATRWACVFRARPHSLRDWLYSLPTPAAMLRNGMRPHGSTT
jgi:hypothetical protein